MRIAIGPSFDFLIDSRMRLIPIIIFAIMALGLHAKAPTPGSTPTMPLSEIKPGMKGEWETVINGSGMQRFHFEVVGVVPNFVGPKRPAILALATDASQILSGPVAGMSGSPCYIDGKLVGAYAYGFTWPKEQALIGITPIEDMFETIDKEAQRSDSPVASQTRRARPGASFQDRLAAWGDLDKVRALLAGKDASETATEGEAALTPLPTPLFASGISARALEPFAPALSALGLEPMAAPVGSAPDLDASALDAGAPLAGVLMDGDFRMAAVGTVTWRDGDTFLAFGHPFFGTGDVEIPAAPAEVLTVVQSVQRSFKLSNVGEIVGSIRQDRLTAVYGELGHMAPTTQVNYDVAASDGETRAYAGKMFRDRSMSPMLCAIGLFESLMGTMEFAEEQTLSLRATYAIEGQEPLVLERTGTGPSAAAGLAIEQWLLLSLLMDNPFAEPVITDIHFEVGQNLGWEETTLEAVRKLSGEARADRPWSLGLTLARYLQPSLQRTVDIPIPAGADGEDLTVFVGDATAADRLERGWSGASVTSFDGLLDYLRGSRSNDRAYVFLLRRAPGLRIDGQTLPALPPSARLLLDNERVATTADASQWQTLWEQALEVPGVFTGSYFLNLKVR